MSKDTAPRTGSRPVVVVAGAAGSGKSTFARTLSSAAGLALLDKDTLCGPFANALASLVSGDPDDRHSSRYLSDIRPLEYLALTGTMFEMLEHGCPGAALTAPFAAEVSNPAWVQEFAEACTSRGAQLTIVWVRCSPDLLRERIAARGESRDAHKLDNWEQFASGIQMPRLRPQDLIVDNSAGRDGLAAAARHLASRLER